ARTRVFPNVVNFRGLGNSECSFESDEKCQNHLSDGRRMFFGDGCEDLAGFTRRLRWLSLRKRRVSDHSNVPLQAIAYELALDTPVMEVVEHLVACERLSVKVRLCLLNILHIKVADTKRADLAVGYQLL